MNFFKNNKFEIVKADNPKNLIKSNKIKKYNCYFFTESIYSRSKNIRQITNFVKFVFNMKYYQK